MIKHIVFWQLKTEALGHTKAQNMLLVKERLMSCAHVGLAGTSLECTHDVVLYSVFENQAALDAYARHPAHEAIKSFILEVRSTRVCMDYEV